MNNEKPIRDQAERLRKRVVRKADHAVEKKDTLPPRRDIHRQKQKKTNVKIKYPVIRLMALFFILLPISFFSIISYLEGTKGPFKISEERAGVELIDVESSSKGEKGAEDKEDEDPPAIEEISEVEQIDLAAPPAPPAPSSGGDKNSTLSSQGTNEKDLPKEADTTTAETQPAAEVSAEPSSSGGQEKVLFHTVQPNETLFRVAMKYYNSQDGVEIIRKANNIKGNAIQAGQVLKIPTKK